MKFLAFFALFFVASECLNTIEIISNSLAKTGGNKKTGTGKPAKKGENPDFCYLSIKFYNKKQTCGCWIYDTQYVVTSGRCVVDCSEGLAANITVVIPQLGSGKESIYYVEKFWVPDDTNNNGLIEVYAEDGIPTFNTITTANIALIKLKTVISQQKWGKVVYKALIGTDVDFAAFALRTKDYKFRACGIGGAENEDKKMKKLNCAEVNLISDNENCKELYTDGTEEAFTPPDGQVCIQFQDNNIEIGEFGGAIYAYQIVEGKIQISTQEIFCTMVGSPNAKKSAPCAYGQIVYCTFISAGSAEGPIAWFNYLITSATT